MYTASKIKIRLMMRVHLKGHKEPVQISRHPPRLEVRLVVRLVVLCVTESIGHCGVWRARENYTDYLFC